MLHLEKIKMEKKYDANSHKLSVLSVVQFLWVTCTSPTISVFQKYKKNIVPIMLELTCTFKS